MTTDSFLSEIAKALLPHSSITLITDERVYLIYGKKLLEGLKKSYPALPPVHLILIPEGEEAKELEIAAHCWHEMSVKGVDRKGVVLAMGGGAATDLAGFVGGCYMRGIATAYIPTTLLGMVDAALGGKTAINLPTGKNLVGLFHKPKEIFCDVGYLSSLPPREFYSGLAEVVKYGLIEGEGFFGFLEQHAGAVVERERVVLESLVHKSQQIKESIVEKDFKESGLRAILNLGHTFGHALEFATEYQAFLHGEAVAIGIVYATRLSVKLGLCQERLLDRVTTLLRQFHLPTTFAWEEAGIDKYAFVELMCRDKKNLFLQSGIGEALNLILVQGLGRVVSHPVERQVILDFIF